MICPAFAKTLPARRGVTMKMVDRLRIIIPAKLRATDVLILAALTFISLLTILFHHHVESWGNLVLKNLGVAAAYLAVNSLKERCRRKSCRFSLRMASILFIYAYLNQAVDKLQLVIYGRWLDDTVLAMEKAVFGVHPTLWMQQFISKPFTEWMMFAYVIYLPMYPFLCGLIYWRRGESATEDYFFTLGLANIICDLGFMLFPAAGPFFRLSGEYKIPLEGYLWTWLGESLRRHFQFVGGTIPSPHCACATVMLLMAYRYHRPSFWILSPVVLSLYVSTVYCRFHYVTDAVAGVIVAIIAFLFAAPLMNRVGRLVDLGETH